MALDDSAPNWRTEAMATALLDLDRAHAVAAGIVRTTGDLDAALALANTLVERLQQLFNQEAGVRQGIITAIWHSRRLSLAELAEVAGFSKARADQFVRKIKKNERL